MSIIIHKKPQNTAYVLDMSLFISFDGNYVKSSLMKAQTNKPKKKIKLQIL